MTERFTGFLDAYDLFGKAIPGIAWFFGIFLILPSTLIFGVDANGFQVRGLASLVVLAILVGLVFGQGVDILGRLFEHLIRWTQRRVYGILRPLAVLAGKVSVAARSKSTRLGDSLSPFQSLAIATIVFIFAIGGLALMISVLFDSLLISAICTPGWGVTIVAVLTTKNLEWATEKVELLEDFDNVGPSAVYSNVASWGVSVFSTTNTTLTSHRSLFAAYLDERADSYVTPTDPDNIAYNRFEEVAEPFFGVPLREFGDADGKKSFTDIYPFITSYLRSQGLQRAESFQARYSFCRSMWVTTSTFGIVFLGLHLQHVGRPAWGNLIQISPSPSIRFILGVVWMLVLTLTIARIFEAGFSLANLEATTFVWATSSALSIGLVFTELVSQFFILGTYTLLRRAVIILGMGATEMVCAVAALFNWLFSYNAYEEVIVINLFGSATLGIAAFLGVSAMAFFDATGSYKRNYIEYLVAETWVGLRGVDREGDQLIGDLTDGDSSSDTDGDGSDSAGGASEGDEPHSGDIEGSSSRKHEADSNNPTSPTEAFSSSREEGEDQNNSANQSSLDE